MVGVLLLQLIIMPCVHWLHMVEHRKLMVSTPALKLEECMYAVDSLEDSLED